MTETTTIRGALIMPYPSALGPADEPLTIEWPEGHSYAVVATAFHGGAVLGTAWPPRTRHGRSTISGQKLIASAVAGVSSPATEYLHLSVARQFDKLLFHFFHKCSIATKVEELQYRAAQFRDDG